MTEPTQQQRIDRLAKWAGLKPIRLKDAPKSFYCSKHDRYYLNWNPFTSLDDARLLLLECDRRNLFGKLEDRFYTISVHWRPALKSGLLATAEQQTEAVWAAAELERNNGTEARPEQTPD